MRVARVLLCLVALTLIPPLTSVGHAATPQEEALALLQKGKDAKGAKARIALFTQAIDMNQSVAEALYMRGLEFYQLAQYDAAIKDFDEAVRIYPDYPFAVSGHGLARFAQGNFAEALTYFDRAIALRPEDPQLHFNRGGAAQELQRWDVAIKDFGFVVGAEPRNADAHHRLGHSLAAAQRMPEALAPLTTALTLDPKLADAYYWRSLVYLTLHNYPAMLTDLDRAIAERPKSALYYSQRGFAKELIDGLHGTKGGEDHAKAIKLAPLEGYTWFRRAEFNSNATPPRVALIAADCAQAIKLGYKVGPAYTLMGNAYLSSDNGKAAAAAFEAARQDLLKAAPAASTSYLDGRIAAARALLDAPPLPRRAALLGDWGIYDHKQLQLEYRLAANGTGTRRGSPIKWTLVKDELTVTREGEPTPDVFQVAVEAGVLTLYRGNGSAASIADHYLRLGKPWPATSEVAQLTGVWNGEDLPSGDESPIGRLTFAADGTGSFGRDRPFTWRADPKNLTLSFPDGTTAVHRYALIANDGLLLELPELILILRYADPQP